MKWNHLNISPNVFPAVQGSRTLRMGIKVLIPKSPRVQQWNASNFHTREEIHVFPGTIVISYSTTQYLVCFTDPFSLSFSPQLSPCFQTQKQIIPSATIIREKRAFFPQPLPHRGSQIGTVLVLNGQISWYIILIFIITILVSRRGLLK